MSYPKVGFSLGKGRMTVYKVQQRLSCFNPFSFQSSGSFMMASAINARETRGGERHELVLPDCWSQDGSADGLSSIIPLSSHPVLTLLHFHHRAAARCGTNTFFPFRLNIWGVWWVISIRQMALLLFGVTQPSAGSSAALCSRAALWK